jgi:protein SDA1
MKNS